MKLVDFNYPLDRSLIAQKPLKDRATSRLLVIDRNTAKISHHQFREIVDFISPGDTLVLNNTKVFKARLIGKKETGARVEILLLDKKNEYWRALVFPAKKARSGTKIYFDDDTCAELNEKKENHWLISFNKPDQDVIEFFGNIPLPHYIKRQPGPEDEEHYQTVYAKKVGSVAAPTAGLHFTEEILENLKTKNITIAEICLHIGPGTFLPIRCQNVEEHSMAPEYFEIPAEVVAKVANARRIIAVGTSVCRALESAAERIIEQKRKNVYSTITEEADLFIYPGYKFKIVNSLITNFHLPCSTPLLLVCAFAGKDLIFTAYKVAMEMRYRFLSYGDAVLII
ncbi:MAG: tRNA preQ1(34) S-adenosylmethionine ribosyltransferase-isomerase QueA [candidate division WOR-3 bacterium]